ncbi:hypothetical protein ZHAS_00013110 [Anopheles sinensis]|uniref:Uncharacterized protein n=1 Tax=Anopheles sinensis TaxID=74873 RepID=A0A084W4L0_ANOSI|nr:hypothetical protein ZHAS_00013110 [Anopheles sinensis]
MEMIFAPLPIVGAICPCSRAQETKLTTRAKAKRKVQTTCSTLKAQPWNSSPVRSYRIPEQQHHRRGTVLVVGCAG